jgi:serine/threonine-protein kinase
MRFIEGESLADALARFHAPTPPSHGPRFESLEFRQLLARFVAACNAVADAHSKEVVHRDLKPANIMLGPFGETLVVDWGLAKVGVAEAMPSADGDSSAAVGATADGQVVGTPAFMAPEQAGGETDRIGPAADVYGLGATLYALLTGDVPFTGDNVLAVLERVQAGRPVPPRQRAAGVPAALEAVCLKAMARKREDRYATATALAADIEHWLADEPVSAYPGSWPARLGRWTRRHPGWAAGLAAALLVALVGLTVATLLLGAKNRELIVANDQEHQARDLAEERFELAQKAVDQYLNMVTENPQLNKKDFYRLRKELLETAIPFYEKFVAEKANDAGQRAARGRAYFRLASVRSDMGQADAALADYEQMQEIFAQLAAEFPSVPNYRLELARSHNRRGYLLAYVLKTPSRVAAAEQALRDALALSKQLVTDFPSVPNYREEVARSHQILSLLLREIGRGGEAEQALRDALAMQKQLVKNYPTVPGYRQNLAISHNSLGNLLQTTSRQQEAEQAYRDALVVQEQLAADFPTEPGYRAELARSQYNLGNLLLGAGRRGEAEQAYRDAIAVQKQVAADFPTVPAWRGELAFSYTNLGFLLATTGRVAEAEQPFRDALALKKHLAVDFPTVPDYPNGLACALGNLAELQRQRHEYAQAKALLDQALPHHRAALRSNPKNPEYREGYRNNQENLGQTLVGAGEHAAAAEGARELARFGFQPFEDCYTAACILSRCVPLSQADAKLEETTRQTLAQKYADEAVTLLREALAKGYKDAAHMKKDTDLDPLRKRDDFQKLLAELEAKK